MDTLKEQITSVEPRSHQTRLVTLSETRWVERHNTISFFKEMLVPIYDTLGVIMGWNDADVSSKAFLMQSTMEKSCFVVGFFCVSRVFGLTASLSATLQSHNFDHAQCVEHIDRVFSNVERCTEWIFITFCRGSRNGDLHRSRDSSTTSMWSTSQSGSI